MNRYSDGGDISLTVSHDVESATVIGITDGGSLDATYAIPAEQLPYILFDMTGDMASGEEYEAAEAFLNEVANEGNTTESLIDATRKVLLALRIQVGRERATGQHEDVVDAEIIDPYDTMTPEELLVEAKETREINLKLLRGRDAQMAKLNRMSTELQDLRGAIKNIHRALGAAAGEVDQ